MELQTQVARRIVETVNQPNILLDPGGEWQNPPIFIPRLNSQPAGWQQFRFGDRDAVRQLDLPELDEREGEHLYVLSTGPYLINRGQVALTALREYELRSDRAQGNTGSLTNYNRLASELPQLTPVLYTIQRSMPEGYNSTEYGPWAGPCLILKCQIPSSHKSPAVRSNLHTVTLLLSTVPVDLNPLQLTGPLSRLLSYHCTCKSGCGTSRSCAHVLGMCIGLFAPTLFRTVKKRLGRLTDISLPADQQPTVAGKIVIGTILDRDI